MKRTYDLRCFQCCMLSIVDQYSEMLLDAFRESAQTAHYQFWHQSLEQDYSPGSWWLRTPGVNGRKLKKYYFPPFYFSNPLYQNFSTSLFSNVSVKQNYCQTLVINHSSTDDASEVWKTLSYVFKIHVTSLVTVIHHGKGVIHGKKVLKNWYHQKWVIKS